MPTCNMCGCPTAAGAARCSFCGSESAGGNIPSGTGADEGLAIAGTDGREAARGLVFGVNSVRGDVMQIQGPFPMRPRTDGWKLFGIPLLMVALGPVFCFALAMFVAAKAVFSLMNLSGSGGRSWIDEIFMLHFIGSFFRPRETENAYHLVLETPEGLVSVRQEGELVDGRIFPGHMLDLRGRFRRGTFVMASGSVNETLGCALNFRASPWRYAAPVLVIIVLAEFFLLLGG